MQDWSQSGRRYNDVRWALGINGMTLCKKKTKKEGVLFILKVTSKAACAHLSCKLNVAMLI